MLMTANEISEGAPQAGDEVALRVMLAEARLHSALGGCLIKHGAITPQSVGRNWRSTRSSRASELRKMRQLEEENQNLKRLVADLSLNKAMLQEVLAKKV